MSSTTTRTRARRGSIGGHRALDWDTNVEVSSEEEEGDPVLFKSYLDNTDDNVQKFQTAIDKVLDQATHGNVRIRQVDNTTSKDHTYYILTPNCKELSYRDNIVSLVRSRLGALYSVQEWEYVPENSPTSFPDPVQTLAVVKEAVRITEPMSKRDLVKKWGEFLFMAIVLASMFWLWRL
jgi:hypothetical protein